ncbi:hypothetical protein [Chryseobacterium sp. M5A1_1a]
MTKEEKIKIYSAYLPYGLTGELKYDVKEDFDGVDWVDDFSKFEKGAIWKLAGFADHDLNIPMGEGEFSGWLWRNDNTYADIDISIKPILYPLEFLTKEIEHEGETFVPLHRILEEYYFDLTKMDEKYILSFKESLIEVDMSYKTAQMLLEYHFNVFNLPEDQYINKATLKS